MIKIDVMFTRTHDGDYIADFDCSPIELPLSSVFFYQAVVPSELIAFEQRAEAAEAQRDELAAQLATVTQERDELADQLADARKELDKHEAIAWPGLSDFKP